MTCDLDFGVFTNKIETVIQSGLRDIVLSFHRQMFCWMDEWFDMEKEEIDAYAKATLEKVNSTKPFEKNDSKLHLEGEIKELQFDEQLHVDTPMVTRAMNDNNSNNSGN